MARDPDESVRLVLAQGEETPPNALKLLCEDASENVMRSAYYGTVLPLGFFIDLGIPLATIKRPTRNFVKTLAQSDTPFCAISQLNRRMRVKLILSGWQLILIEPWRMQPLTS